MNDHATHGFDLGKTGGNYLHRKPTNHWHKVEILKDAKGNLIWNNAANRSWSLLFKDDKLCTGQDCANGEQLVEIVWGNEGDVSGVLFGTTINKATYFRQRR